MELNDGTHWFWHANIDAHGTTTNKAAMQHSHKWKTPAFLHKEESAQ
jgi:hypothetical protein